MPEAAVGIDLGTTNSCVAVYNNGKVEIIKNDESSYVMPSWVGFTDDGIITGHEAKDQAYRHVRNTVFEAKRLIGQRFDDEDVQRDIQRFPYQVVNDNGVPKIEVTYQGSQKRYLPQEISAYILQKLKDLAESRLGQQVGQVVVTVPAYFNDLQRTATIDAATIAGFKKVKIINEPTAAALAFSYQNKKRYKRNILVYDFGGGTFDVSVVTVGGEKCKVRATKGDLHLGGTDIDMNLVNFIKEDFRAQYGEDIVEDEEVMRRMKNCCERVKVRLSGKKLTTEIELYGLCGRDYVTVISRNQFEQLNEQIFESTLTTVKECLEGSGLNKNEIDEVILVGGSSRIPKVQEMLKEYFGKDKMNKGVNPDEAVAFGAAIQAVNIVGNKCVVEDVLSSSLGIAVLGTFSSFIIPCNSRIPACHTEQYQTAYNDQDEAEIKIYQGESQFVTNNIELGQFTLTGLRKAPAGCVSIDVCFEINAEGILSVTASEVDTCNVNSIQIDVKKKGLSSEQIQQRVMEVEQHREHDRKRMEFLQAKYDLERLCDRLMERAGNISNNGVRAAFEEQLREVSEWLQNVTIGSHQELHQKRKKLEDMYNDNFI